MGKLKNTKNKKFTSLAWILAALVLVVAIVINMIVARLNRSWDLSPNKQFSLSNTSSRYLDELDAENVTVDFYFLLKMDQLEADAETVELYQVLKEYASHSCINFVDVDPDKDLDQVETIKGDNNYNLSTGDIVIQCDGYSRWISGTSMYNTEYASDGTTASGETFVGENLITGTIKAVVDKFNPVIYFLTGHGEKSINDSYSSFAEILPNYEYQAKELDLTQTKEVPDDAALVLIAAPTSDLTDAETDILNSYLDDGGNLSLLMSPNGEKFAYTNLEKIMASYAMYMDYDHVYETNAAACQTDDKYTIVCNLNKVDSSDESSTSSSSESKELTSMLTDSLSELGGSYTLIPESRSFVFENVPSNIDNDALLLSNNTAVGEPYGGTAEDPREYTNEQLNLAGYAKDISRNDSKLVFFGSADFLDNDHIENSDFVSTQLLYLTTITWMYSTDIDMGITDKAPETDYIDLQNEHFSNSLLVIIGIIPIAVALVGVGVWIKRRNA